MKNGDIIKYTQEDDRVNRTGFVKLRKASEIKKGDLVFYDNRATIHSNLPRFAVVTQIEEFEPGKYLFRCKGYNGASTLINTSWYALDADITTVEI